MKPTGLSWAPWWQAVLQALDCGGPWDTLGTVSNLGEFFVHKASLSRRGKCSVGKGGKQKIDTRREREGQAKKGKDSRRAKRETCAQSGRRAKGDPEKKLPRSQIWGQSRMRIFCAVVSDSHVLCVGKPSPWVLEREISHKGPVCAWQRASAFIS